MEKICVFGANGRTGVHVIEALVKSGYTPIAVVRDGSKTSMLPGEIDIRIADVLDYSAVQEALAGADAVISVIGHIKGSDPRMQTKGIEHIVQAMQERGMKRILSLTGTGVRRPGDTPSLLDRLLNFLVARIDPDRVKDGIAHASVLASSDLDWTVLRVLKLTDKSGTDDTYNLTLTGPVELFTPRAKAARMLVDLLEEEAFYKTMPISSP